jgi:hypothetical protein
MTREDVTLARVCSRSKLEKLEHGQNLIRPGDVRELCRVYQVDQPTTDLLTILAYGTADPGWLEYGDFLRPHFELYLWLESAASTISTFESEVVHGLFQTPDYARAIELATCLDTSPREVEQGTRVRLDRQRALFTRPRPPRIELVLAETALLRPVGSAPIMAAQRSWLRRLARRDHVEIRVLRLDAGPVPAMMGAFSVLDFDDPADPSVGYVETYDGARYPEKPAKVELLRRRFAVICEKSVSLQEYAP